MNFEKSIDKKTSLPSMKWIIKEDLIAEELWEFGAQPYKDFFYNLVKEKAPSFKTGYRWLTQWKGLGFAVLELPIEAHVVPFDTTKEPPKPFVTEAVFKAITNAALAAIRESKLDPTICILILIHGRTPDQPDSGADRWKDLVARIAEDGNPIIVFGGHEHQAVHPINDRQLTIIGVPHDLKQTTGTLTLPGVGYVQLTGLGTNKLRCEITKLENRHQNGGASWVRQIPARFELAQAHPHNWNRVTKFTP